MAFDASIRVDGLLHPIRSCVGGQRKANIIQRLEDFGVSMMRPSSLPAIATTATVPTDGIGFLSSVSLR